MPQGLLHVRSGREPSQRALLGAPPWLGQRLSTQRTSCAQSRAGGKRDRPKTPTASISARGAEKSTALVTWSKLLQTGHAAFQCVCLISCEQPMGSGSSCAIIPSKSKQAHMKTSAVSHCSQHLASQAQKLPPVETKVSSKTGRKPGAQSQEARGKRQTEGKVEPCRPVVEK